MQIAHRANELDPALVFQQIKLDYDEDVLIKVGFWKVVRELSNGGVRPRAEPEPEARIRVRIRRRQFSLG